MSYCYEIMPKSAYKIFRNCPKCGQKMDFINTENFRVNANGDILDVWLIYQCDKCKHTYNLTIYDRVKKGSINNIEYEGFLRNDRSLAIKYGINKSLFERNKAEIDIKDMEYKIIKNEDTSENNEIVVSNPYRIKVRSDKLLAEIMSISRSKISKLLKNKEIEEIKIDDNIIIYKIKKEIFD